MIYIYIHNIYIYRYIHIISRSLTTATAVARFRSRGLHLSGLPGLATGTGACEVGCTATECAAEKLGLMDGGDICKVFFFPKSISDAWVLAEFHYLLVCDTDMVHGGKIVEIGWRKHRWARGRGRGTSIDAPTFLPLPSRKDMLSETCQMSQSAKPAT